MFGRVLCTFLGNQVHFYLSSICEQSKLEAHLSKIIFIYFNGTLEFRIDGIPRLSVSPFFAILRNLIQHSPFVNFGEFCQPPLLFQTPRLLIHVHSRQR